MRAAGATLALGLVLLLSGGAFDGEPLYVPGVALLVLALGAVGWIAAAARGVTLRRELGARRPPARPPPARRCDGRARRPR